MTCGLGIALIVIWASAVAALSAYYVHTSPGNDTPSDCIGNFVTCFLVFGIGAPVLVMMVIWGILNPGGSASNKKKITVNINGDSYSGTVEKD